MMRRGARWCCAGALLLAALLAAALLVQRHRAVDRGEAFRNGMRQTLAAVATTTRPGAIWVLGDSIMQQLDVGRIDPRAANFGIGGDTLGALVPRVGDYPQIAGAAQVLIAIGTNDIAVRPPEQAAADYAALLARLPPGLPLLTSAILPVDETILAAPGRNARAAELNRRIAALCAVRPGCRFIDAGPRLAAPSGALAPAFHRGDGLHLSPAGYDRLVAALREAIAP